MEWKKLDVKDRSTWPKDNELVYMASVDRNNPDGPAYLFRGLAIPGISNKVRNFDKNDGYVSVSGGCVYWTELIPNRYFMSMESNEDIGLSEYGKYLKYNYRRLIEKHGGFDGDGFDNLTTSDDYTEEVIAGQYVNAYGIGAADGFEYEAKGIASEEEISKMKELLSKIKEVY